MSDGNQLLDELLEESSDLHVDAMRKTNSDLEELVEVELERASKGELDHAVSREFARERMAHLRDVGGGAAAVAGLGVAALAINSSSAFAASSADVQMLQTQASIENLAVATYSVALGLSFIGGSAAIPVVKAFVAQTKAQHEDHAAAFNATLARLGAKKQTAPDPVLAKVVNKAKRGLTSAGAVVALALELELENGAAQTYVANTAALSNSSARSVTASIMGVEAQHVAVLLAVQALIKAGDTKLISLPPNPLSSLPARAGSVGFPNAFYPTSAARPRGEGAVA